MGASDGAVLIVGVLNVAATDVVTGVTYDGVAMTKLDDVIRAGGNITVWYLNQPSSGANNIVVTKSGGAEETYVRGLSFTGGNILNTISNGQQGVGGASETASITSTVDNSWAAMFADDTNATPIAASTNSTLRGTVQGNRFATFTQTDAPKTPAGSISMSYTPGGSNTSYVIFVIDGPQNVSVSPAVIGATATIIAPSVTGTSIATPAVITAAANIQAPTVSVEDGKWSNQAKNSSSWTNQSKS